MCTIEVAVGLGNKRWESIFVEIPDSEVDDNDIEETNRQAELLAWEQAEKEGWNNVSFTKTVFVPPTGPLIDLEGII